MTRAEIGAFARKTIKKQAPSGEFERAQKLAVRLHQIPPGYDLLENQIKLLESQVAGLYDADADRFYVVRGTGKPESPMFQITAAHELVHAYRDVDKDFMPATLAAVKTDVDWAEAIRFLAEGDATLLGTAVGVAAIQGIDAASMMPQMPTLAKNLRRQMRLQLVSPALEEFPLVLKEELLSAYSEGIIFAATLYAKGGLKALDAAYDHPPRSTEQVLHPEKYGGDQDDEPTVFSGGDPTAALGEGWKLELANVMGEFETRSHLTELLGREEATRAAAGWDGSRYFFCTHEKAPAFFGMLTTWDSEGDAAEFAEAWARWASLRDGAAREVARSDSGLTVRTKEGLVVVRRAGADVLVADGVPPDRVDAVFTAIGKAARAERKPDASPLAPTK